MQNTIKFILALNAVVTLLTAAFVYMAKKNRLGNSVWFVYNILFSIWNFCLYKSMLSAEDALTLYWFRVSFVSLIFMVPVYLHFLSIYSDKEIFRKQLIGKIYALFFLIFAASVALPEGFIKGVASEIYFGHRAVPGIPFHLFTFVFTGFILCGFYYLLYSKKIYLNLKRNQRLWVFLGMLLGMSAPLSFFLSVYKITFFPAGLFFVIPSLVLVSYTILKYHVPEINVVINKIVLLAYTTIFIILAHTMLVHILYRRIGVGYFESSVISGCIVLINLLFIIHYERAFRLKKVTDYVVYETRLRYYNFLENFNSILNREKDLSVLLDYIVDSLKTIVGVECVSLYLFEEESGKFKLKVGRGIDEKKIKIVEDIEPKNPLIDFLNEGNIFVANEARDFVEEYNLEAVKETFNKINAKLTIPLHYSMPLYYSRDIVGFLNLGDKDDKSDYTKEEIDILNAFGRQIGVCLDSAKLFARAIEDDITRLYRYNYFQMRIDEELERSKRYNRPFSFLMIDIDDFKNVNDAFGHEIGNKVLKRLAYVLKRNLRKVDIAARYGGEEFAAILPETDKAKATVAGQRLRAAIEKEFSRDDVVKEMLEKKFYDREHFSVTVSIGVSAYRPDITKEVLIKEADEALYRAKRQGKNIVC